MSGKEKDPRLVEIAEELDAIKDELDELRLNNEVQANAISRTLKKLAEKLEDIGNRL
jgi:hypothetical protein